MTIEASSINRLKEFKFRVEINGVPSALVQEFDPGKRSHGVTEHAGAGQNHASKEAGMIKYGNARIKNVVPIDGPGQDMWVKFLNSAQNPLTGNGGNKADYTFVLSFFELLPAGNPVRTWHYYNAWVVDYSPGNRSGLSENKDVIEEVEIAFDRRDPA